MASSHRSSEEEARRLAAHLGKAQKKGREYWLLLADLMVLSASQFELGLAMFLKKRSPFINPKWKKEMVSQVGPPGYDTTMDVLPKTKSVKRNERKKEKRLQPRARAARLFSVRTRSLLVTPSRPSSLSSAVK
ncbi:hypothetical protein Dimus_003711 [Dionaea muscipula]